MEKREGGFVGTNSLLAGLKLADVSSRRLTNSNLEVPVVLMPYY